MTETEQSLDWSYLDKGFASPPTGATPSASYEARNLNAQLSQAATNKNAALQRFNTLTPQFAQLTQRASNLQAGLNTTHRLITDLKEQIATLQQMPQSSSAVNNLQVQVQQIQENKQAQVESIKTNITANANSQVAALRQQYTAEKQALNAVQEELRRSKNADAVALHKALGELAEAKQTIAQMQEQFVKAAAEHQAQLVQLQEFKDRYLQLEQQAAVHTNAVPALQNALDHPVNTPITNQPQELALAARDISLAHDQAQAAANALPNAAAELAQQQNIVAQKEADVARLANGTAPEIGSGISNFVQNVPNPVIDTQVYAPSPVPTPPPNLNQRLNNMPSNTFATPTPTHNLFPSINNNRLANNGMRINNSPTPAMTFSPSINNSSRLANNGMRNNSPTPAMTFSPGINNSSRLANNRMGINNGPTPTITVSPGIYNSSRLANNGMHANNSPTPTSAGVHVNNKLDRANAAAQAASNTAGTAEEIQIDTATQNKLNKLSNMAASSANSAVAAAQSGDTAALNAHIAHAEAAANAASNIADANPAIKVAAVQNTAQTAAAIHAAASDANSAQAASNIAQNAKETLASILSNNRSGAGAAVAAGHLEAQVQPVAESAVATVRNTPDIMSYVLDRFFGTAGAQALGVSQENLNSGKYKDFFNAVNNVVRTGGSRNVTKITNRANWENMKPRLFNPDGSAKTFPSSGNATLNQAANSRLAALRNMLV